MQLERTWGGFDPLFPKGGVSAILRLTIAQNKKMRQVNSNPRGGGSVAGGPVPPWGPEGEGRTAVEPKLKSSFLKEKKKVEFKT
jgi:hypothetical protein